MADLVIVKNPYKLQDNDLKRLIRTLSKPDLIYLLEAIVDENDLVKLGLKSFFVENFKVKLNGEQTGIEPYETRKN